ncbi:MAG: class I SAM-dependent methyltransferase [Spirochaetaceae bacterium]|nr:class I SAM-dependent methyltransferase [Spirochaetaceae bacterium]
MDATGASLHAVSSVHEARVHPVTGQPARERYTDEWIANLLDGDKRFGDADPGQMLGNLGVTAGCAVVDYGCGPGLFALAAARLVGPGGTVYAVDLEPRMVELARRRAAEAGLANVRAVPSDGMRAALPDGVADFILCVQIMHYHAKRQDRVAVARDLRRLLRAEGRVVIMQWSPKRGDTGISYRALAGIMRDAGLITDGAHAVTDELYRTLARKPPGD